MSETHVAKPHLTREHLLVLLRAMVRIRRFEEKCTELYQQEKIRGFLRLYIGEEAIAVGAMQALARTDAVVATYREHGHALARGVAMDAVMAEMYGKAEGCSGGRGGSMHLFDAATCFYGGNAIVGGGLPLAVGLALAEKMDKRDGIAVCFFGEGAVAEGEFHECLNLAELWRLPVLFFCENNLYAMGTRLDRSESQPDIHIKAQSYNVAAEVVDGMDVVAVEAKPRRGAFVRRSAAVAGRRSSNAGLIVSERIRCSIRNSIATRPRSKNGNIATQSIGSPRGCVKPGYCTTATLRRSRRKSPLKSSTASPLPRAVTGSRSPN